MERSEIAAALAKIRLAKATPFDRAEAARKMVAGRRKARKHRQAKVRGAK